MKKRLSRLSVFMVLSLLLSLIVMQNTQAYLDPAATSYLIQIVSGIVIACGVTVGIFWKKIRLFFRNLKMKRLEKKLEKQGNKKL